VSQLSDGKLVRQLQLGDLGALGVLYDRHRQLVFRTALGITGDPEAAADLLQDVFLRMHRFSHRIDTDRPLQPWLYRATTNLTYSWIKRRHRWSRFLNEMAASITRNRKPSHAHTVERDSDEWQSVQQALCSLPIAQRVVVVLYYLNDLSLQETSDVLEIPVGTVKSRLHYGRIALKKQLELDREVLQEVGYEFT